MANVVLLYPFFVSENRAFPPLSLPALKATLQEKGHNVLQIDANIRLYQWLASPDKLDTLEKHLVEVLAQSSKDIDNVNDLERRCFLIDAINGWLPYIRSTLDSHDWDLRAIDGIRCLYLLDRLETILGLEWNLESSPVQLSSEMLLTEVRSERPSMIRTYVEEELIPIVRRSSPTLIGISLMVEQQLWPTLIIAHAIRNVLPTVHIVCGGGYISAIADKIGRQSAEIFSLIDSFVCFDGEHAIQGILNSLERNSSFDSTPNLIWFDRTTQSIMRTQVEETGSLDLLPRPEFDDLDMTLYTRSTLPYYVSKGCSYGRCAYCSDPAYSTARSRSTMRAVDEIEYLVQKYRPKTLLFVDSYINPQQMAPIAEEMIRRKISVEWAQQTRMDRFLTTEAIHTFAAAGCTELWFGMETINDRMIRLIRKGSKESIIRRILNDCCEQGIRVTLNCMIGFPTETLEEAHETMAFIDSLTNSYPSLMFKCNTGFVFVPRLSSFGSDPSKFGVQILEEYEWSPRLEWVPPAWRYNKEFRTLDGQMFEKSYAGAASLRRKSEQSDSVDFKKGAHIALSNCCHICSIDSDIVALWKRVFDLQERTLQIQRTRGSGKRESRSLAASGFMWHSLPMTAGPHQFAYVIDDGSWRRIVPLNAIYELVVRAIKQCRTVGEVINHFALLYPNESDANIQRSLSHAFETLALCDIISIEGHEVRTNTGWSDHLSPRHNMGLTNDDSNDSSRMIATIEQPLIQISIR